MKRRRFFRNVFFPSLIPLILIPLGQTLNLPLFTKWVAFVLMIGSAGLYLKRLHQYWDYADDIIRESSRLKKLIWLILLSLPLELGFLFSISAIPDRADLAWIFFAASVIPLFVLLTLLLQFYRLSPGIKLKSFRVLSGLIVLGWILFSGWSAQFQFIVFFFYVVWIFNFDAIAALSKGRKTTLVLISLLGILFLLVSGFDVSSGADNTEIVLGNVTITAKVVDSLRILKSSLLPILPAFHSGLRRILLALFIVFPMKILLRPLAEWLKTSLRIRTKLALSYLFSSVIPALLVVVLLLFGMLFMMGAFWQQYIGGLVTSRTDTLYALWNSSILSLDEYVANSPMLSERAVSDYLKTNGITAIFADLKPNGTLGMKRVGGAPLPGLAQGDSLKIDLIEEIFVDPLTDKVWRVSTKMPVLRLPGAAVLETIGSDSLIERLSAHDFGGLTWFEETPYITRWMQRNNTIVGLFQPFGQEDLAEMKDRCGADLKIFPLHDMKIEDYSAGGMSVQFGEAFEAVMQTGEFSRSFMFPNVPISFPALIPTLNWKAGTGFVDSHSIMLVETSLFSVFGVLFTTENFVNRIYVAIFAVLAGFLGMLLLLVVLIGFSLAGGITRSISRLRKGTQQLREGDLSASIEVKSRDELGDLATSFNLMVSDLNRMLAEVKEKERLEGELEAAKAIQEKLLPDKIPDIPGFQLAAASLPAKQVGGDYYDFLPLSGNRLGLAVGDVSGKGMPAALLMANLQASLRTLAQTDLPPDRLVERLNVALHDNTAPQMFATFFYGALDAAENSVHYVNAGHNFPIVCGNGRMEKLTEGGLLLGVLPEGKYQSGKIELKPGEILALYSDGITEAINGEGKEFGEERLVQLLMGSCEQEATTILHNILKEVEYYCGIPQDDVTLMVLKRA
jgi:serine phosphatase RsbU (regulator of sigma subunit)